jgi:hypothetical protein
MAGRGPLVALRPENFGEPALMAPGEMSLQCSESRHKPPHMLRLPTVHVHGTRDEGLQWHRRLAQQYCDPETTTIVQWDGGHRVPIKASVVAQIAAEIYRVARECGVTV